MSYFTAYIPQILFKCWEHLYISLISVGLGVIFAVPLGALLAKMRHGSRLIISIVSFLQTIPALALLSLMIPLFGIGKIPAIATLFLYSLLPILRNTYTGIRSVDPIFTDTADGMGMSKFQTLILVELPLSLGVIMAGIRVSTVYVISWATLTAYIGGGGLGDFIFNGLTLYKTDLLLMGTIPVTILALSSDQIFKVLEKKFTVPRAN
ncbi:ABC transporter permease [Lactovum odontotermitis]